MTTFRRFVLHGMEFEDYTADEAVEIITGLEALGQVSRGAIVPDMAERVLARLDDIDARLAAIEALTRQTFWQVVEHKDKTFAVIDDGINVYGEPSEMVDRLERLNDELREYLTVPPVVHSRTYKGRIDYAQPGQTSLLPPLLFDRADYEDGFAFQLPLMTDDGSYVCVPCQAVTADCCLCRPDVDGVFSVE